MEAIMEGQPEALNEAMTDAEETRDGGGGDG